MVKTYGNPTEKITFNMPKELKMEVERLKNEMKVSLSSIYNEAIANYIKEKEMQRWSRGASRALQDEDYSAISKDLADNGDIYEY